MDRGQCHDELVHGTDRVAMLNRGERHCATESRWIPPLLRIARRGLRGRQNLSALVLNILNKGVEIFLNNSSQSPCAVDQHGISSIPMLSTVSTAETDFAVLDIGPKQWYLMKVLSEGQLERPME